MYIKELISLFLIALDTGTWIQIGLLILFILLGITLILAFLFAFVFNGRRTHQRMLENSDYNVRIYSYDFAKQRFICFDKTNIGNLRELDEKKFYSQFPKEDLYLVQNWLKAIAENEKHANFLQVNINISSSKKPHSSMLELTGVNRQKKIIHFASHLLPYSYSTRPSLKKKSRKTAKLPSKFLLKTMEDAQKYLSSKDNENIGAVYYIKLYRKDNAFDEEGFDRLKSINKEMRLSITSFLSRQRKMVLINETETIIIDTDSISKFAAMTTAGNLQICIQQFLNAKSDENGEYGVAIGVSNGTYYQKNYALAKEQSNKMADAIIKGLCDDKILFYDETFFVNYQQAKAQRDEVRMVIRNATFKTYFTPTFNISTSQQDFFMLKVVPYGTSVEDFTTMIQIAKDFRSNGCEKLFSDLNQKCVYWAKFARHELKIAIRIPFVSIRTFAKIISEEHSGLIKWIVTVDETDILTKMDDPNTIAKDFKELKKNGIQVGLIIQNPSSGLRTRVLKEVNYFFIPPSFTTKAKDKEQSHNDLRNIQNNYGIYRIPFIYYDLNDLNDVELGIHYGGTIFESDGISMASSHLIRLDRKIIEEVTNITKKVVPKNTTTLVFTKLTGEEESNQL